MGSVWVADHLTLETQVAVKFVSPEVRDEGGTGVLARFKREASSAAKIKSPHVVQTYDHGVMDDGTPYIIMELLEGESLASHIARSGPLNLTSAAAILRQIANALTDAHRLGIVHRDIKPDNIFLTRSADQLFVKVLDFGIAKQRSLPGVDAVTRTGMMVGTPCYMSPEQILTARDVDHQADLWAVAVVAYEMMTGRLPFEGETIGALIVAITSGKFVLPSELGVAGPADSWFQRSFSKDPRGRFRSAEEMVESFRQAADAVPSGQQSPTLVNGDTLAVPPRATPLEAAVDNPSLSTVRPPRVRRILAVAVVALALGAIAVASSKLGTRRIGDARDGHVSAAATAPATSEPIADTDLRDVAATPASGTPARDLPRTKARATTVVTQPTATPGSALGSVSALPVAAAPLAVDSTSSSAPGLMPVNGLDCSSYCDSGGYCTLSNGKCIVGPGDCAKSSVCRDAAMCTSVAGRCAIASSADCQRSTMCAQSGNCTFSTGRCVVGSDADCEQSLFCKLNGSCKNHGGIMCISDAPVRAEEERCKEWCRNAPGSKCKFNVKKGLCEVTPSPPTTMTD
jgi:hypothetical protein